MAKKFANICIPNSEKHTMGPGIPGQPNGEDRGTPGEPGGEQNNTSLPPQSELPAWLQPDSDQQPDPELRDIASQSDSDETSGRPLIQRIQEGITDPVLPDAVPVGSDTSGDNRPVSPDLLARIRRGQEEREQNNTSRPYVAPVFPSVGSNDDTLPGWSRQTAETTIPHREKSENAVEQEKPDIMTKLKTLQDQIRGNITQFVQAGLESGRQSREAFKEDIEQRRVTHEQEYIEKAPERRDELEQEIYDDRNTTLANCTAEALEREYNIKIEEKDPEREAVEIEQALRVAFGLGENSFDIRVGEPNAEGQRDIQITNLNIPTLRDSLPSFEVVSSKPEQSANEYQGSQLKRQEEAQRKERQESILKSDFPGAEQELRSIMQSRVESQLIGDNTNATITPKDLPANLRSNTPEEFQRAIHRLLPNADQYEINVYEGASGLEANIVPHSDYTDAVSNIEGIGPSEEQLIHRGDNQYLSTLKKDLLELSQYERFPAKAREEIGQRLQAIGNPQNLNDPAALELYRLHKRFTGNIRWMKESEHGEEQKSTYRDKVKQRFLDNAIPYRKTNQSRVRYYRDKFLRSAA